MDKDKKKSMNFTDEELQEILKKWQDGGTPLFDIIKELPPYLSYMAPLSPGDKKMVESKAKTFAEKLEPAIVKLRDNWKREDVQMAFVEKVEERYGKQSDDSE